MAEDTTQNAAYVTLRTQHAADTFFAKLREQMDGGADCFAGPLPVAATVAHVQTAVPGLEYCFTHPWSASAESSELSDRNAAQKSQREDARDSGFEKTTDGAGLSNVKQETATARQSLPCPIELRLVRIISLVNLPPSPRIVSVTLEEKADATQGLPFIAALPNLTSLSIMEMPKTFVADGFAALSNCAALKALHMFNIRTTLPPSAFAFIRTLPSLRELELIDVNLTNEALKAALGGGSTATDAPLKANLRKLDLSENKKITNEGLGAVFASSFPVLHSLNLQGLTKLTSNGLQHCLQNDRSAVRSLDTPPKPHHQVQKSEATTAAPPRKLPALKELCLNDCSRINDTAMSLLKPYAEQLVTLRVARTDVSDSGLRCVVPLCSSLRHLEITDLSKITCAGVAACLGESPPIGAASTVPGETTPLTMDAAPTAEIGEFPKASLQSSLEYLEVGLIPDQRTVSGATMDKLIEAMSALRALRHCDLEWVSVTDAHLLQLSKLPCYVELDLSAAMPAQFSPGGISAALRSGFRGLQVLRLPGRRAGDDDDVESYDDYDYDDDDGYDHDECGDGDEEYDEEDDGGEQHGNDRQAAANDDDENDDGEAAQPSMNGKERPIVSIFTLTPELLAAVATLPSLNALHMAGDVSRVDSEWSLLTDGPKPSSTPPRSPLQQPASASVSNSGSGHFGSGHGDDEAQQPADVPPYQPPLQSLQSLRVLRLDAVVGLTGLGLSAALRQLSLRRFEVDSCPDFTDADAEFVFASVGPQLEHLEITGSKKLTDTTLLSVTAQRKPSDQCERFPNLSSVDVSNCSKVTDRGLKSLASLPTVKKVWATGTRATKSFKRLLESRGAEAWF